MHRIIDLKECSLTGGLVQMPHFIDEHREVEGLPTNSQEETPRRKLSPCLYLSLSHADQGH